jgi:hypothetical protein
MEHCLHVPEAVMTRTIWTPTLAWLAAVAAALAFAVIGPNESNLMGRLPTLAAKRPDQQRVLLPQGLPARWRWSLSSAASAARSKAGSTACGWRKTARSPGCAWPC